MHETMDQRPEGPGEESGQSKDIEVIEVAAEETPAPPSPFGSAGEAVEEVVREVPPIVDMPREESAPAAEAEPVTAQASEAIAAPVAEPEPAQMAAPAPVQPTAEPAPAPAPTSGERSIYDDPIFGPLKRVLVDLVGEE